MSNVLKFPGAGGSNSKPATLDDAAKRSALTEYLEGGIVGIHLDATREGVKVPEKYKADFALIIKLSWRYAPGDLTLGGGGIAVTLSFQGSPSPCFIPWSAIFRIGGAVWPADMPKKSSKAAPAEESKS